MGEGWFGTRSARVTDLGVAEVNIACSGDHVGGLVGWNNLGTVTCCHSTGAITGNVDVGGLVGWNSGSIKSSFSNITISGGENTGGLAGTNGGDVSQSWSMGMVGGGKCVGGLVGHNRGSFAWPVYGSITESYSTCDVTGTMSVGGLLGYNSDGFYQPYVSRCYSTGAVSGDDDVGGLVGWNKGGINRSYSTGSVSGIEDVGGIVGENRAGYGITATSIFWDVETSRILESDVGIGRTTAEMQTASTFLKVGWDFVDETVNGPNDIWKMWGGYDYPRLAWEAGPNTPLVFVDVHDPGFYGQMSRYEVTNGQYCDFLNAALASGDITVNGSKVEGAEGSNGGGDYAGQLYYNGDGSGYSGYGATNGGAARIRYSAGAFGVDDGFGNHPVTYVSWYGAMAFANYYGYCLPAEDQWQAVADYDGTYIYGCGETIDPGIANFRDSEHPDGTMPVGSFGAYGYGMSDMAGNVWEWTGSSLGDNRVFRGGSMGSVESDCAVSIRGDGIPHEAYWDIGFRVCR